MRTITEHEKRTLRIGAGLLLIYLVVFYGGRGLKRLEHERAEHQNLVQAGVQLKRDILLYQKQLAAVRQLRETFHLDPAQLSRKTLVAEASAAIQTLAGGSGI